MQSRRKQTIFESERIYIGDRTLFTRARFIGVKSHSEGKGGEQQGWRLGRRGLIYYVLLTHVTSVTWDHYNRASDNENANESARIDMDMRVCNLVE